MGSPKPHKEHPVSLAVASIHTAMQALTRVGVKRSPISPAQSPYALKQIEYFKKQLLNPSPYLLSKTVIAPDSVSAAYTYESAKATLSAIPGWNITVSRSGDSISVTALRRTR